MKKKEKILLSLYSLGNKSWKGTNVLPKIAKTGQNKDKNWIQISSDSLWILYRKIILLSEWMVITVWPAAYWIQQEELLLFSEGILIRIHGVTQWM